MSAGIKPCHHFKSIAYCLIGLAQGRHFDVPFGGPGGNVVLIPVEGAHRSASLRSAPPRPMPNIAASAVPGTIGETCFRDVIDFLRVVKLNGCDMAHVIAVLEEVQKE